MQASAPGRRLRWTRRSVVAALALGVSVVGPPVFLLRWGGWPLDETPGWEQFRKLPIPSATDQVILGLSSIAVWGIWGQFTGGVVALTTAVLRGRPPRPRRDDPIRQVAERMVGAAFAAPPAAAVRQPLPALAAEGARTDTTGEASHLRARPTEVGLRAGGLALAGVVLTLDRRRRVQQRHRAHGRRIAMAPPGLAHQERMIREGTDTAQARLVEWSLRAAAAGAGASGLPRLRWVEATTDAVLLAFAEPRPAPPGFTTVGPAQWLTDATIDRLVRLGGRMAMPTPALVPVGTTAEGAAMLVDLEASGVTSVAGPHEETLEFLRAVAVAATTAAWSEPSTVVQVGSGDGLVQVPEARSVSSLAEAMTIAEEHLDRTALALWSLPGDTTAHARAAGVAPADCRPLVVVSAEAPADRVELTRLAALAERPGEAVAVVVPFAGDDSAWPRFELGEDGWLQIEGIDSPVRPHRLARGDAWVVAQLLESVMRWEDLPRANLAVGFSNALDAAPGIHDAAMAATPEPAVAAPVTSTSAEADEPVATAEPVAPTASEPAFPVPAAPTDEPATPAASVPAAPGPGDAATTVGPGSAEPSGAPTDRQAELPVVRRLDEILVEVEVLVRVLGEVEAIRPAQSSERSEERIVPTRQKALEALTYLALSDAGVPRRELERILFPDGPTSERIVFNTVKSVLKLVGGQPPPAASGPYFLLSERVVTDYGIFCDLVAQAFRVDDQELTATLLGDALDLVRGEPFTGVSRSYTWAVQHRAEMVALVVDAAEELAEIRLAQGDWRAAEAAARRGLRVLPTDERMYRLIMRSLRVGRDVAGVRRVFDELCDVIADPDHGVQPEDSPHAATLALFEALTTDEASR